LNGGADRRRACPRPVANCRRGPGAAAPDRPDSAAGWRFAWEAQSLDRVYALVARLAAPIDYKAIDGQPVDLVFLLLSPPDARRNI
jgi:hypothetical protein